LKTIGIVGGMGPYATVEFYRLLLQLNPVEKDWLHPRTIIDSNTQIPSRTRALLYGEESPVNGTVDSINALADIGADFVALPCNSIHYWYDTIKPLIKIPWLNLIETVSNEVMSYNFKRPLVLGGYAVTEHKLYNKYIKDAQYLDDAGNEVVQKSITEIKNTNTLKKNKNALMKEILLRDDTDSIIFACTELTESLTGLAGFDSNHIYASHVLEIAKGGENEI